MAIARTVRRAKPPGAEAFVPKKPDATIPQLRAAADRCRGCDLYKRATQAVFGEGPPGAKMVLIGEQPGDQEDVQGRPFVGAAGKLLDRALGDAGIDRSQVYVTNAVKHFKWTPAPRGKRRLHQKPNAVEVRACRPWLVRELEFLKPSVVVLLGATAGQSLFGAGFRVGAARGKVQRGTEWAPAVVATVHPSALLRMPDREEAARQFDAFVEDLRRAWAARSA